MNKDIKYYMSLPYSVSILPEEGDAGYVGAIPELPGCLTSGDTWEEVIANMEEAKKLWLEAALVEGIKIKEPDVRAYSGQLRLRMPKELHRALAIRAQLEGVSMNQYCVYAVQKALQE